MSYTKDLLSKNTFDLSTINGVLNVILAAFDIPQTPVTQLPPKYVLYGGLIRPGLSAEGIAKNIISRQAKGAGRQVGDVFADGSNVEERMEIIRVEEIINALLNDAVVQVVIGPGIAVKTQGPGNLGAPVISFGQTITKGLGNGIIR